MNWIRFDSTRTKRLVCLETGSVASMEDGKWQIRIEAGESVLMRDFQSREDTELEFEILESRLVKEFDGNN